MTNMPTKVLIGSLIVNLLVIVFSPMLFNFSYEVQSLLWLPILASSFTLGNLGMSLVITKVLEERIGFLRKSYSELKKLYDEAYEDHKARSVEFVLNLDKVHEEHKEMLDFVTNEATAKLIELQSAADKLPDGPILKPDKEKNPVDWKCYKCLWEYKNGELRNNNGEEPPSRCEKCKNKHPTHEDVD